MWILAKNNHFLNLHSEANSPNTLFLYNDAIAKSYTDDLFASKSSTQMWDLIGKNEEKPIVAMQACLNVNINSRSLGIQRKGNIMKENDLTKWWDYSESKQR